MTNDGRPIVTVLGSLHYDITVVAPDRPRKGETLVGQSWRPKCGGKGGNQAVAAARAGARVAMVSAVGDDLFGSILLANLDRSGVDRRFVRVESGLGSGMSVAIFDREGDYGAIIVSGANLALSDSDVIAAHELLLDTAVLVLQNEVPEAANAAAARAVRDAGGIVLLNAAPARAMPEELVAAVDILIVNAIEAEMLGSGQVVNSLEDAMTASQHLLGLCAAVIVTAGKDGVAFANQAGDRVSLPAEEVFVASTHGAGDAFVGTLAAALARGEGIEGALQAANRAAALLVATPEADRI